jgi:hypothetical protein
LFEFCFPKSSTRIDEQNGILGETNVAVPPNTISMAPI